MQDHFDFYFESYMFSSFLSFEPLILTISVNQKASAFRELTHYSAINDYILYDNRLARDVCVISNAKQLQSMMSIQTCIILINRLSHKKHNKQRCNVKQIDGN